MKFILSFVILQIFSQSSWAQEVTCPELFPPRAKATVVSFSQFIAKQRASEVQQNQSEFEEDLRAANAWKKAVRDREDKTLNADKSLSKALRSFLDSHKIVSVSHAGMAITAHLYGDIIEIRKPYDMRFDQIPHPIGYKASDNILFRYGVSQDESFFGQNRSASFAGDSSNFIYEVVENWGTNKVRIQMTTNPNSLTKTLLILVSQINPYVGSSLVSALAETLGTDPKTEANTNFEYKVTLKPVSWAKDIDSLRAGTRAADQRMLQVLDRVKNADPLVHIEGQAFDGKGGFPKEKLSFGSGHDTIYLNYKSMHVADYAGLYIYERPNYFSEIQEGTNEITYRQMKMVYGFPSVQIVKIWIKEGRLAIDVRAVQGDGTVEQRPTLTPESVFVQ